MLGASSSETGDCTHPTGLRLTGGYGGVGPAGGVGTVRGGARKLIAPCERKPSGHGAESLRRLRSGLTYKVGAVWPDQA
eukprot:5986103-Alexandrium_andersonii.AAC.1